MDTNVDTMSILTLTVSCELVQLPDLKSGIVQVRVLGGRQWRGQPKQEHRPGLENRMSSANPGVWVRIPPSPLNKKDMIKIVIKKTNPAFIEAVKKEKELSAKKFEKIWKYVRVRFIVPLC